MAAARNPQIGGRPRDGVGRPCLTGLVLAQNPHLRGPAPGSCPVGECDGTGFVIDEATDEASPCRCRPQRVAAARTRSLASTIPERFRHAGFDRHPVKDMDPEIVREVRRYCRSLDERLAEGRGLVFFGSTGTGKTTLAMVVAQEAMRAGASVAVYDAPQLMRRIHATYSDPNETVAALMEQLEAVDLLVLDDVAVARQSDWVLEQFYSVINGRYQSKRALVVTADVEGPEKLADHLGARSASRLFETCTLVPMFGADQRVVGGAD